MTLYDLRYLFVDDAQLVIIYDLTDMKEIYKGEFYELPEEMEYYEIMSIDTLYPTENFNGYITINVEAE